MEPRLLGVTHDNGKEKKKKDTFFAIPACCVCVMSWRMRGRQVVECELESLTPVEGEEVEVVVEGWCAVLREMSVPMLVGGDIIRQYDAVDRPRARAVVIQSTREWEGIHTLLHPE